MTPASRHRGFRDISSRAVAPVDIDLLVYFRIVFGCVMCYWVARMCFTGSVESAYIAPRYHFHYFGFGWVRPLAGNGIYVVFLVSGVGAACIALGCFYRCFSILFAVSFSYLFLIDKCLYQNHYYLVCLVAWLMPWLPAHRSFSLDAIRRPSIRAATVPAWTLGLLRFQIAIPYAYGGIAKLSADWLAGEPLRTMLAERATYPLIGQYFAEEWCVQMFVLGGLLFDLLVVPALLWPRTRFFAFLLACCFHFLNATLFTIGIFPWLMTMATLVYLPPGSLRRLLQVVFPRAKISHDVVQAVNHAPSATPRFLLSMLLLAYLAFQMLFPLRHFVNSGHPNWTEEGHCFSWHMLLRGKQSGLRFQATDRKTGKTGSIDLRRYVTPAQLPRVSRDPRLIHQLSRLIVEDLRSMGIANVELRVLSLVSMNGRKPQLMIDPTVDLPAEPVTWRQPSWIVPLSEPLRDEPWNVPLSEWERYVQIPGQKNKP